METNNQTTITEESLRNYAEATLLVKTVLPFGTISMFLMYFIVISPAAFLFVDYHLVLKIDLCILIVCFGSLFYFNVLFERIIKQLVNKYGDK